MSRHRQIQHKNLGQSPVALAARARARHASGARRRRRTAPGALLAIAFAALSSCSFGPRYEAPPANLEAAFKNAGFEAPPPQGSWWALFDDQELARLIKLGDEGGPAGLAALARYDQARAAVGLARVDGFPIVTGDAYARRIGDSDNANFSAGTYEDYRAALNLTWEIDLWGRVRKTVKAAKFEEVAAAYEYQAAALSLRAEITRDYLALRFADAEIRLLESTEEIRGEARRLMELRLEGGASSQIDFERSITEHESVKAELEQLRAERARFENALAALTGQSASGFRIAPVAGVPIIPRVPSSTPSELLRRRPDLAASERRLAAASERIGLVVASYLPRLSLTGEGGFQSLSSSDLFDPASQLWRLGPEVTAPVFQGGRAFAEKARREAVYREQLENYRDTLVTAVRETEDSLGDARHFAAASASRTRSATSAKQASELARRRYLGGTTDYFEVVDADRTTLTEQRAQLATELARGLAATRLIQALGGGWERAGGQ